MSVFNNTWIFIFTIALIIFVIAYLNTERALKFLIKKTFGAQEEILEVMDKLLISQDRKKIKRNCWIFSSGLSFVIFLMLWPNVIFSLLALVFVFIGTWYVLRRLFRALWERHCDRVVNQMVEALTIMCNSLKVGLSLGQSMERVIKGYPGPLAKEFGLVLNKMSLGQSLEESLDEMAERVKRRDIDMLVSTVNILKETGGNLAETFFVMAETLRERQKMEKKIKALTAQGMMQAKIMSALPFFMIGIFYFLDKDYIAPLLFTPMGWLCLIAVLALVLIGGFVMKKIVTIKV